MSNITIGKGILYYAKKEIVFTQKDLDEVRKNIFNYE